MRVLTNFLETPIIRDCSHRSAIFGSLENLFRVVKITSETLISRDHGKSLSGCKMEQVSSPLKPL